MSKYRGRTILSTGLVLAAFVPGLIACQNVDNKADDKELYGNEFGVLMEGLGTNIGGCTLATTGYDETNEVLTINLAATDDAVISAVDGKLLINGYQCEHDVDEDGDDEDDVPLTTSTVDKLIINGNGTSGDHKVVVDLLPGGFGTLLGNNGGITIDKNGATTLHVGIRGSDTANNIRMSEDDAASDPSIFAELTGNLVADLKMVGGMSSITVALAGGNDQFNAQDNSNLTAENLGLSGAMGPVAVDITAYGGDGNDTMEGGDGNDTLYGGAGNDNFTTATIDDGEDTYHGGAGEDEISYSERLAGVRADIHPGYPSDRAWIEGDTSVYATTMTNAVAFELTVIDASDSNNDAVFAYNPGSTANVDTIAKVLSVTGAFNSTSGAAATAAMSAFVDLSISDEGNLVFVAKDVDDTLEISGAGDSSVFSGVVAATTAAASVADADDGAASGAEKDDIRNDVENITGTDFDDVLVGSDQPNELDGGEGNDQFYGGIAGADCAVDVDVLTGGAGDDIFFMGPLLNCKDEIVGGNGSDTVDYQQRVAALTIHLDNSANDGEATEVDNIRSGVETVLGGEANDDIKGSSADETLRGGSGADTIDGGNGDDFLSGGPGDDKLIGGGGDDTIDEATAASTNFFTKSIAAFSGSDEIHGGTGLNKCTFNRGGTAASTYNLCYTTTSANCTEANSGVDGATAEFDHLTNCNHVVLDGGADLVTGSDGDDIIEGGGGIDTISGGKGNDIIYGEADADILDGGEGLDTIHSGIGADQVTGGDGDDTCFDVSADDLNFAGDSGSSPDSCEL